MRRWFIRGIFFLILLISLQGPELIDQYVDHLSGHVEELKYQVGKLKGLTGKSELELRPLIAHWIEIAEPKEPVLFISALFDRYEKLTLDLEAFRSARFWTLPFTFISHFEFPILDETLRNYRWGISLTLSVIPFLLLGLLFGYLATTPLRIKKVKVEKVVEEKEV